ncbi:MAG: putative sugar O-methyltransferase [Candidatus Omnitrophota bacterium]
MLDKIIYKYRMAKNGEDCFIAQFENNPIAAMAYELFCSSLYYPARVAPTQEIKDVIDHVVNSYFLAKEVLNNCPQHALFIGGIWEKLSRKFAVNLKGNDVYSKFVSIGSRIYKNFELRKNKPFNLVEYSSWVAMACMQYDMLSKQPTASHIGYSRFNYPHFHYKNTILNIALYSYDMVNYVFDKIKPNPIIAEIGAGDGAVARDIIQNIKCKYIIFDIPEILTRSQFLLSSQFPDKKAASISELKEYGWDKTIANYDIIFLPSWSVTSIPADFGIDLWINTHSLGEMPLDVAYRYCEVIDRTGCSFVSINRERDIVINKNWTIYDSRKFISRLKNLKIREVSYPTTSNYMAFRPSNVRLFLIKSSC